MRRIITAALSLTVLSSPTVARVERIEMLSRQDFAPGIEFGDAGAYEKLRGRAFFALDPNAAANAPVTDLKLAPRDARGLVEFSAEFLVLRPKVARVATARCCMRSTTAETSPFFASSTKPRSATIRRRSRMRATGSCSGGALLWPGRRGQATSRHGRVTTGWCCAHPSSRKTAHRSPAGLLTS